MIKLLLNAFILYIFFYQAALADTKCTLNEEEVINVKYCGAKGDGKTDDSASIQSAINLLKVNLRSRTSKSGTLLFPEGRYVVKSQLQLEEAPNDNWMNIVIQGQGSQATQLISRNNDGIIKIAMKWRGGLIEIKSIGFVAGNSSTIAGNAIKINIPIGGNRHNRSFIMRDVQIASEEKSYFNNGLISSGLWRPLIENVMMTYGPYKDQNKQSLFTNACFMLMDSYGPEIWDTSCWSAKEGLHVESTVDPGSEGFFVFKSNFVNVDYGIIVKNLRKEPGGFISNTHINAFVRGIYLKGKKFVSIKDSLLYNETKNGSYEDIYLEDCDLVKVYDNTFHFGSNLERKMIVLSAKNSNYGNAIRNNMFHANGIAVDIDNKTISTQVSDNIFFNLSKKQGEKSADENIVDKGINTRLKDNYIESNK